MNVTNAGVTPRLWTHALERPVLSIRRKRRSRRLFRSEGNGYDIAMAEPADHPGVRFPPPALYVLAVLGGYLMNRRSPLPIGGGVTVRVAAWALTLAWALLTVSSVGSFRRVHTSIVPVRPATSLVISGPYRFTRNPMYVGLAMLTVALSLFMNSWWPILLLIPVLVMVRQFVIAPEERYLERRFGADYVIYTQRVRRWL
jgi:protein-S-isoprenylcysteine O-methyltransferase Ste14